MHRLQVELSHCSMKYYLFYRSLSYCAQRLGGFAKCFAFCKTFRCAKSLKGLRTARPPERSGGSPKGFRQIVLRLGEVAEIEVQMFSFALKFNQRTAV